MPSLVNNLNLVTKIYFPRGVLLLASIGAAWLIPLLATQLALTITNDEIHAEGGPAEVIAEHERLLLSGGPTGAAQAEQARGAGSDRGMYVSPFSWTRRDLES